jgi:Zinc knuckle
MYLKRINTLFFHFTEVPGGLPKEKPWFLAGTRFLKDLQISLESLATFDYIEITKTLVVRFKQQEQFEDCLRRLGEVTKFKETNGSTLDVPITSSLNPGRNSRITIETLIKWVPIDMDFKLVEKALTEYGTVVESSRISIYPKGDNDKACKVETERIRVAMRLKKDIPTTIQVDGVDIKVYYAGQPPTCMKCKKPGHMVKDCPKKKRGWEADDTEETEDNAANNTEAADNPDPVPLQQENEAQNQQIELRNSPEAPPQTAQPTPQGKSQQERRQIEKDKKLAKKLQQELNKQVEEQERLLPEGQTNEPLGKADDQQTHVQAESDQLEASTSENTTSIEPFDGEMDTTPVSDPKRSTKRKDRASPRRSSKEYSDSERNQKKKRGQQSESDRESEHDMEEGEVISDEDTPPQGPEHHGPVAQLAEGPATNTVVPCSIPSSGENFSNGQDHNTKLTGTENEERTEIVQDFWSPTVISVSQRVEEPIQDTQRDMFASYEMAQMTELPSQNTEDEGSDPDEGFPFFPAKSSQTASTVVPLAERLLTSTLSTIQTPRLDSSIVETVDLASSVIAQSDEQTATNNEAPGSIPGTAENFRPHIPALFGQIEQLTRPGITQVTGSRPKTNHAGNTAAKNNKGPVPREKSFTDQQERAGTSAPSFAGRRNPTSGTGPPKTL